MWREVKLLEKQRMKRWIVGLLLPLLFAGMLVVAVSSPGMFDFETVAIMVTVLGTLVFILRTVTSMSDAVSSERQTGTWIALITTPMEPERIIHGKLIGPMLRHWPMLVVVLTPAVVAVVLGRGALLLPVMIFLIVTMWGIAAQVTGLFLSLAVRKAGAATTLNLGLYLGLWLGLPVALAMIGGIARINVSRDLSEWVLVLNPVFMVGQTMEAGISRGQNWESSVHPFRVFGESTSSGVFTLVLMALWLVVIVFCSCIGHKNGRRVQENFLRLIPATEMFGRNWPAIELTTAAGVCAMVDLHRKGDLPKTGFITQESVSLPAFNNTIFGLAYEAPSKLESAVLSRS
jgi:ABC-type transport system involved in multi-copper enzyme maturation permease subunit